MSNLTLDDRRSGCAAILQMPSLKLFSLFVLIVGVLGIWACGGGSDPSRFSISDSNAYEASLFRQHCAICHGPEAQGKVLENGTKVPSLREGEFKFHTETEIYKQIANGGNGMTPFRDQLTERELHLMAQFVHDKLRHQ